MSQISKLQRQARKAYERFYALGDNYDCGEQLLATVCPEASHCAVSYNEAMAELERIDPDYPESLRGSRLGL
jgi:hypothetical protein